MEPQEQEKEREGMAPEENNEEAHGAPEAPEAAPTPTSDTRAGAMSSTAKIASVVVGVGAIALLGGLLMTGVISLPGGGVAYDPEEVVASVNGAPILRGELENRISQVESAYEAQGAPVGEEQPGLRNQILDELVQTALLKQKATEAGIVVEDSEVDAEYQNLISLFGSEEALQEQLTLLDISPDQLRADIRDQVMIQKYLESATAMNEVTVTEEELRAEYDASVAGAEGEGVPTFEEVRDLIEQQLRQQKTQEIIQAHIDELVAQAQIEKNI